jgi:NAD(P)H-quinone oxidoreductase subunit 5
MISAMTDPTSPPTLITWLAMLPPLLLLAPLLVADRRANQHGVRFAEAVAQLAMLAFLAALFAGIASISSGPFHTPLVGIGPVGISLHLDALTAVILGLVSFLGAVISRYSVNYLHGEERQGTFSRWLAATLGCVMLFILSGNLVMLTLSWMATSLCLHKLLVHYHERSAAVQAAWTKFVFSRLAESCLVLAMVLLWKQFGTLELDELRQQAALIASGSATAPAFLGLSVGLLVFAAIVKSAQFPFHSWLPDSLESPTPVSALMHAGIINGGGFLIIRLSSLILLVPSVLNALAVVGTVTAVVGSLVMLTQNSIKRSLAWSTVSQMGFMMLQCGLGAFALATLHIVGHSLYKSYAFLSSGSVVALARSAWSPSGSPSSHPALLLFILSVSVSLTFSVGHWFGLHFLDSPDLLVLGSIFMMALGYMLWNLWGTRFPSRLATWGVLAATGLAVVWFSLHHFAIGLLGSAVAIYDPSRSLAEQIGMVCILLLFAALLIFQAWLPKYATDRRIRQLYVHASNGFYVSTLIHRFRSKPLPPMTQAIQR